MRRRDALHKAVSTAVMAVIGFYFMMPLFWMVSSSLKAPLDVFKYPFVWIPERIRWKNYTEIWASKVVPFSTFYLNSIKLAVLGVAGRLLISSLAAYAFGRMEFRGKNVVFMLFLATMMIPSQITLIPRFALFNWLGLYNTHLALILPSWFSVTSIFLLRQFYQTIPKDMSDAAMIDGAGHFRIWAIVVVPLAAAAMVSLIILGFINSWNDFLSPLIFLTRRKLYTVPLGVNMYHEEEGQQIQLVMAAATSSIVPILVVFLALQKHFIQGIVTSGIKG